MDPTLTQDLMQAIAAISKLEAENKRLRAALQNIAGGFWGRENVQEYANRMLKE
jgi:hypothetical protein